MACRDENAGPIVPADPRGSDPPIFGGSAILLPSRLCRGIAVWSAGLPVVALAVLAVAQMHRWPHQRDFEDA